ncbi:MAG: hypothetical protein MAG715_00235 [Methanonatronarchaeales archaeon]|nr:hypothetical protein [Methanonatronarchaeales archaeon]
MAEAEVQEAVRRTLSGRVEEINRRLEDIGEEIGYFEKKYGLETDEFYRKFEEGEMGDDMDFFEWKSLKEVRDELVEEKELLLKAI